VPDGDLLLSDNLSIPSVDFPSDFGTKKGKEVRVLWCLLFLLSLEGVAYVFGEAEAWGDRFP